MRASIGWSVVVIVLAATACTSGTDGRRSACSAGPAYTFETSFPSVETVDQNAPECVPRCGSQNERASSGPYGNAFTTAALPTGSCSYDGEICQMAAVRTRTCPDGEKVSCSYTPYECRCEDGQWRCYHGPAGASACACRPKDGG